MMQQLAFSGPVTRARSLPKQKVSTTPANCWTLSPRPAEGVGAPGLPTGLVPRVGSAAATVAGPDDPRRQIVVY